MYHLDGKEIIGIGSEGHLPSEELSIFDVRVDGNRRRIPARLWRDCYNPNFDDPRDPVGYIHARLSNNGKRLTVEMGGSDGAGGYIVTWHLQHDGRNRREIVHP